jgi:hypothetical protein
MAAVKMDEHLIRALKDETAADEINFTWKYISIRS